MRPLAGLLLASALALAACHREQEAPIRPSPEPTTAPAEDAGSAPRPSPAAACAHRRPFETGAAATQLALPTPFEAFTPCEVLRAIHPDYDAATGKSSSAGTVRIDQARLWPVRGRNLLAVLLYRGSEAESEFVCGMCRVAAHVAVVEKRGASLTAVGKPPDPWGPKPEIEALFNGRAEFDTADYPFTQGEPMLAIRTPWSAGMAGTWTNLTLYRLNGDVIEKVFEYGVAWDASGMGTQDDDLVQSRITFEPRAGAPSDLRLKTTEERCHLDYDKADMPRVCKPAQVVGTERWRFQDTAYRRIEGKQAPLPRILQTR